MGLFDFLLGRKPAADTGPARPTRPVTDAPTRTGPLPWPERLQQARGEEDFDWTWGNARAHRLVHGILEDAAPRFGTQDRPARIKEVPDEQNIDLRGTFDAAPVRFAIWMSFGSFWTIEMRVPELALSLDLERDHEKIPRQRDVEDPFDDDEAVRVFVGKGIFVEGDEADVAQKLELWARIPEAGRAALLAGMEHLDGRNLYCTGSALRLNQQPGLGDLDDPVDYMESCAAFLATVRDALAGLGQGASQPAAATTAPASPALAVRVACTYCSTRFFQTPMHHSCPNCGAAPGA